MTPSDDNQQEMIELLRSINANLAKIEEYLRPKDEYVPAPYDIETKLILGDHGAYDHWYFMKTRDEEEERILFTAKSNMSSPGIAGRLIAALEQHADDLLDRDTQEAAKRLIQDRFKDEGIEVF